MARLRIRVELNRGGVGVPLQKLASVVHESERFFQMLAEDVQIQKDRGEWLAFDFDHESLNFTAEYVGPVSNDQVNAFANAFGGATSLRRATITQFTRIADAIDEDELIGFGLYHSDQELEPEEWRCLSRRDALRIADEIQLLMGATGENGAESHLPAVTDPSVGERMFKDRRDRNSVAADRSRWSSLVRDVEAKLSKRIGNLEVDVQDNTHMIQDLRQRSQATEESFRTLLSSVDTFCGQATRNLERLSAPPAPQPEAPISPPPPVPGQSWRGVVALAIAAAIVVLAFMLWPSKTAEPMKPRPATVSAASPAEPPKSKPFVEPPKPKPVVAATPVPKTPAFMVIRLEAREPAWVSLSDEKGSQLFAKTMAAAETRSVELTQAATLRTGNAGGLEIHLNGQPIGSLGPVGKVREVQFKDGSFKILGITK